MVGQSRRRVRVGTGGATAPAAAKRAHVARNKTLPAASPPAAAAAGVKNVVRTAAP